MELYVGIDIGSTTVKTAICDGDGNVLRSYYERHFSMVREKALEQLEKSRDLLSDSSFRLAVTGSRGMGTAKAANLPFVQEVYATAEAVRKRYPDADRVIELGGEDAKIIFFKGSLEERMNGSCAGGTGAFIDQMAALLDVDARGLDKLSLSREKIYPIASRCGVFAKSDIQPILNQGARKEDVARSVFQAVVNQTVGGLTQGRDLGGKIIFLGGPLHFLQGLRRSFCDTLSLDSQHGIFPRDGQVFAAIGRAMCSAAYPLTDYAAVVKQLETAVTSAGVESPLPPLFESRREYDRFLERHGKASPPSGDINTYQGDAYLGVDRGSTTTKLVLTDRDGGILYSFYAANKGNPVPLVKEQLEKIYSLCGDRIKIAKSAVTGYGEDLIKNAFNMDAGVVETIAHLQAARQFCPDVDFIIDIGGQDIKCFKIKNGAVDGIMLNEACSSGCGSFIETFARALGYDARSFSKLGLFDKSPVNLGSRCTVFMNSRVKQAQKDGAGLGSISAGLSISVVKNAVYKVIRARSARDLGEKIVVQGGTFLNDAVLRAFEQEIGKPVIRPRSAGLMGAYGAALYRRDIPGSDSGILSRQALAGFVHTARPSVCGLCRNRCSLTVNSFGDGRRFISGNRCSRPLGGRGDEKDAPDVYEYKLSRLCAMTGKGDGDGSRGKIGIPLGLNIYDTLPFWFSLFTGLDFEVVISGPADRSRYLLGRRSIPSDTVCYPAKLMHGQLQHLIDMGLDTVFYPCMPYNFDEGRSDNNYNCPVVAYYPELLAANVKDAAKIKFLIPYVGLHRPADFEKKMSAWMLENFNVPASLTKKAVRKAYRDLEKYRRDVIARGERCIAEAAAKNMPVIVLAGRPYHVDPEINHGINKLITSLGAAVVSEDSLSLPHRKSPRKVLNQWTFHSRMYRAAESVRDNPGFQLVQLVSFGCGIDAITTDEMRDILEKRGKLYTQIKIDDISNQGAVKIRLRSLLAAAAQRGEIKRQN